MKYVSSFLSLLVVVPVAVAQVQVDWIQDYPGVAYKSYIKSMVTDSEGNVYAGGSKWLNDTTSLPIMVKIDNQGNMLWEIEVLPAGARGMTVHKLLLDGNGDILAAGGREASVSPGGSPFLMKYAPTGQILASFIPPWDSSSSLSHMDIDQTGNVFVAGVFHPSGHPGQLAVFKLDSDLNEIWSWVDSGYLPDPSPGAYYSDAGTDSDGNYLLGTATQSGYVYEGDIGLVKLSSDGDLLWGRIYDSPFGNKDMLHTIDVAVDNSVYCTGHSYNADSIYQGLTIKCDTDGNLLWETRYHGPVYDDGWPWFTGLVDNGNLVVVGACYTEGYVSNSMTVKLTPEGDVSWLKVFSPPDVALNPRMGMAVSADNRIGVVAPHGFYVGEGLAAYEYDSDGQLLWYDALSEEHDYLARGGAATYDQNNNLLISGPLPSSSNFSVVKYVRTGYTPGDLDGSEQINIADLTYFVDYLFRSGPAPDPLDRADLDCSHDVNVADLTYIVDYLFHSGAYPCID